MLNAVPVQSAVHTGTERRQHLLTGDFEEARVRRGVTA